MAEHIFDVTAFRALFPAFADTVKYPDAALQSYFTMATCYVSPWDSCSLTGACLDMVLNLLTAHLATIYGEIAAGDGGVGVLQSATIDKVSITVQLPPTMTAWQVFLARTPYGLQAWAMLQAKAVGGWSVGGSIERRGFRKAGGRF